MRRVLGICIGLLLATPVLGAPALRYVALVDGGKNAGHQFVTTNPDGSVAVDYIFKDNGRGPELKETYTLGADGTFASYHVQGRTTFGAPVDESFSRAGDRGQWKSTSDHGDAPLPAGAMYVPLGGTPNAFSVAIGALAKRADGKLPLVPSGTLTMRKVDEAEVGQGRQKRKVQLLAITGVGFTPNFVWATTGAAPRLFAFIAPGFVQLVEEGWEKDADALEARQKKDEAKALVDLQQRLRHPLPGSTLVRNARVFDSERAALGAASDVLLRDGRIAAITPTGSVPMQADHVIDAGGRVLAPGLFDMHAHYGAWDGGLHLATGITTIRDMGNDNATLQGLIADEKAGHLLAPHIVPAGFIEGESPMSARNGFVVKNMEDVKHAIDWYAAHGYPQIKIYNSFPKDLVRETTAYAHSKGLRVSGHIPAFMRAQQAVEQGYDEIQHINQVLLNFYVDDKTDTRTLTRFYLPAQKTADLDFDSKPVQDYIRMLADRHIVIDSTLTTFDFLRQRAGELSQAYAAAADHMPPDVQRGLRVAEMDIPDDATAALYEKSYEKMIDFVGRMYRAGVPLVAG
ncbi:MAG TPA: amidohydrolase, partial [Xanthomonadaceae bacterium]|nr:amidohydrolase [Xanthomonadaceae bacterium]